MSPLQSKPMRLSNKKRLIIRRLIRRGVKFINGNPKPYEIVSSTTDIAADQSYFPFSSLPSDVVLNCIAHVPRCYYPKLSCVSKTFQSLVRSPELAHMRSLRGGKRYPVFCFCFTEPTSFGGNFHWFNFDLHEKEKSILKSFPVLPLQMLCCSTVSIGSTIYFVGGTTVPTSPSIRFLDTWSGELCEGPSMKVARKFPGVTVVDGKLYVVGGCNEDQIQVEVYDPKTQTWEVGPLCPLPLKHGEILVERAKMTKSVAVEGKIYGMSYTKGRRIIYDTEDGRCVTFELAHDKAWSGGGVCVINNVIYVYHKNGGLMWYDSKDKVWRVVEGFKLDKTIDMPVGMIDCNGKLAFLWEDLGSICQRTKKKKIWCTIIALDRSGVEIHGTVERSDLVGLIPIYHDVWRCLDVSD